MPTAVSIIVGIIVIVFLVFAATLAWADWYSSRAVGLRRTVPDKRAGAREPDGKHRVKARSGSRDAAFRPASAYACGSA